MITGPGWTDGGYSGASAPLKVDRSIACETPFALAVVRTQLKAKRGRDIWDVSIRLHAKSMNHTWTLRRILQQKHPRWPLKDFTALISIAWNSSIRVEGLTVPWTKNTRRLDGSVDHLRRDAASSPLQGPDDLDRVKEIQKGYKAKPAYRPIERT